MAKKFLVVLVVLFALVPLVVSAASGIEIMDEHGDGYWRGDTWYVDLRPGETAEATLKLRNNTGKAIRVDLGIDPGRHCREIEFWWDDSVFTIPRYHTVGTTLHVKVGNSAPPSRYGAGLTVEWTEEEAKPPYVPSYKPPYVSLPGPSEPSSSSPPPVYHLLSVPPTGDGLGLGGWVCIVVVGLSLITAIIYMEKGRRRQNDGTP